MADIADRGGGWYRPVMHIRRLAEAATYERDGLQSHVLLDAGDFGSKRLVVTWVVVPPDGGQRPHVHDASEQVYIIVRGRGMMTVGDEQAAVEVGDLVLVPPQTSHSIANASEDTLIYASATAPPQSMADLYSTGLA
ncbi:MAG: cupin domain-containing protein [Candidatus Dormibacteraeota bacterium]|uniref:Cupin domain-containing protein n=1 Tax=Candidatus Amunia macphersoniae TaxID=3127014 RepID=A0A934KDL4_9BACT|nr:cupin domain-containing protein [Candidatus Dormibacteraeota bacterium]